MSQLHKQNGYLSCKYTVILPGTNVLLVNTDVKCCKMPAGFSLMTFSAEVNSV